MPVAKLLTLTCNATEDNSGDDEVLVKVFGGTRYGQASLAMNTGQTWDINLDVPFSKDSHVKVEVWDQDAGWWLDPDDLLGVHHINAAQSGAGAKSAEFNSDGASYTLAYEVVAD